MSNRKMESFGELASFMRASRLALGVPETRKEDAPVRVTVTNATMLEMDPEDAHVGEWRDRAAREVYEKLTPKRSLRKRNTMKKKVKKPDGRRRDFPIRLSGIYNK